MARYQTDGDLDAGFGGDGTVTVDFGDTFDEAYGVTIDSMGPGVS